jgi:hypothetical protein
MPRVPEIACLRSHLTFANVMSSLALFVALGGSAFAAGVLPVNSVGRTQLQAGAVTSSKLAPASVGHSKLKPGAVTASALAFGSVGLQSLDPTLRTRLNERAETGPGATGAQGLAGPQGPVGPRGPSGPGAVRIHYFQDAAASPTIEPAVDVAGFHLKAACEAVSQGTQLMLSATPDEPASVIENISVDGGKGQPESTEASSSNLQFHVPAGTTALGGPAAETGHYSRIFAQLIYMEADTTVQLTVVLQIDGVAGTCAIDGVGVPARS